MHLEHDKQHPWGLYASVAVKASILLPIQYGKVSNKLNISRYQIPQVSLQEKTKWMDRPKGGGEVPESKRIQHNQD